MSTKKILNIVLNGFTNDARVLKTSRSLKKEGYAVDVLALHDSGLPVTELVNGINVHRLKLFSKKLPKSKLIQILKYLEFLLRASLKYRNKYDAVHCNDLNALFIGVLIKKLSKRNISIVYDAHEYETERDGMKRLEKKILKFFERRLIKYARTVICVSNEIANCYATDYGIDKPKLVLNCPILHEIHRQDLFRNSFGIRADQKIFLYQGGIKSGRGIELLLEAFSNLDSDKNVLVCMGYGPLESLIKEKAAQHATIFFHPAVSPAVLLDYTSSADYGILFYEDTCLNHRYCSPNKIFEYLMAGLPVLTSNLFEMKRLTEAEGIGVVAGENSVDGFRNAVKASLNQDYYVIQRNVFSARIKYCWEEQEKVLREIYSGI